MRVNDQNQNQNQNQNQKFPWSLLFFLDTQEQHASGFKNARV